MKEPNLLVIGETNFIYSIILAQVIRARLLIC